MHLTPQDVAFVQLCIYASLKGVTLNGLPNYAALYEEFLSLARDHTGRHEATGADGKRISVLMIDE